MGELAPPLGRRPECPQFHVPLPHHPISQKSNPRKKGKSSLFSGTVIPFVMEAGGRLGQKAVDFLNKSAEVAVHKTCTWASKEAFMHHWATRLSVELQRGVADMAQDVRSRYWEEKRNQQIVANGMYQLYTPHPRMRRNL